MARVLSKPPPRPLEILRARARAWTEKRPILCEPIKLPPGPEIFLDLETDPDGGKNYVWLIGFCFGRSGPYQHFFAETPDGEEEALARFLRFAERYPTAHFLTFSGSRFEERVLKARFLAHGLNRSLCARVVDLSPHLWRGVALPVNSEDLKTAAKYFGYTYKHPDLDGLRVASDYQRKYLRVGSAARRKKLKQAFLEYNEDDVRCLPFILNAVANLSVAVEPAGRVAAGGHVLT